MDFSISADQKRLRDEIANLARVSLSSDAAERDRTGQFSRELWDKCGEALLHGLVVPTEYGGRGLDPLSAAIAVETLGNACDDGGLTFSICAHLLACAVPVWRHGSEEQRRRLLPAMSNGSLIAANAMSEPGSGSDAFALTTRADRCTDGFRINGTKTFCTNAPIADLVVTYAATAPRKGYHGGITAFLVPRATPGMKVGPPLEKLGLRTSPMAQIIFEDAMVADDAVLGTVGGGAHIFAESMDWERACLVAAHVGTMQRLLDLAVSHARGRGLPRAADDRPQSVSHALADVKARLDAARLLVYRAASRLGHARDAGLDASIAKLFASESLVATANAVTQIFGSEGLTEGHPAERALRDAVASTIYSGTSEIQRNIIARWLGV